MEDIVNSYVAFIKVFEKRLALEYNFIGNPRHYAGKNFERIGKIDDYNFRFHGAGCEIIKDGVICDYDSLNLEGNNIDFSLWKITRFIETHPKYKLLNYTSLHIEQELYKLIEKEVLSFQIINNCVYQVYQI